MFRYVTFEKFYNSIVKLDSHENFFNTFYSVYVATEKSRVELEKAINKERLNHYYDLFVYKLKNDHYYNELKNVCKLILKASEQYENRSELRIKFLEEYEEEYKKILKSIILLNIKPAQEIQQKPKKVSTPTPKISQEKYVYEKDFDYLIASRYMYLRKSAIERNKEFNLTLDDVRDLISTEFCAYTGIKLTETNTPDGEKDNPCLRTIDRLDPDKGYIKGNVYAVCLGVNTLKEKLFETATPCNMNIGLDNILNMINFLKENNFKERSTSNILNGNNNDQNVNATKRT